MRRESTKPMKLPTPGRSVEEWIAKSNDDPIPDRVRIRVFDRYKGKCYITGVRLVAGNYAIDHIIPLYAGGQHRESNLAPIWIGKHKEKNAEEAADRAKVNRVRSKHLGIKSKGRKIQSRGFTRWEPNIKQISQGV